MVITFLSSCSERDREAISADGRAERLLHDRKPAFGVEDVPGARGRPARIQASGLGDRAIFNKQAGAEASEHGTSPFLS
jgi:hypothetical protein